MAVVLATQYVLAVHNLQESIRYYEKQLGFTLSVVSPPGWAFLNRGAFKVMLGECKDALPATELGDHAYFAYVNIEDAEKLYNEYSQNKVIIRKELTSEPWGMKEFAIQTIDGHRIMFGEDLES